MFGRQAGVLYYYKVKGALQTEGPVSGVYKSPSFFALLWGYLKAFA